MNLHYDSDITLFEKNRIYVFRYHTKQVNGRTQHVYDVLNYTPGLKEAAELAETALTEAQAIIDGNVVRYDRPQSLTYEQKTQFRDNIGAAELLGGKIPSSQLPSYVDDVLEYTSRSAFPATGESGKIYVTLDANLTYRWTGSTYVEISQSLALGETAQTAFPGDRGLAVETEVENRAKVLYAECTEIVTNPAGWRRICVSVPEGYSPKSGDYLAVKFPTNNEIANPPHRYALHYNFHGAVITEDVTVMNLAQDKFDAGTVVFEADSIYLFRHIDEDECQIVGHRVGQALGDTDGTAFPGERGKAVEDAVDDLDERFDEKANTTDVEAMIKVQDTQPTESVNKMWVKETPDEEIQVPTVAEMEAALTTKVNNSDMQAALALKINKPETNQNGTNGQILRTNGDGTTRWDNAATVTEITNAVDTYLAANFTNPSNPPLDRGLTSNAAAAPADMVGDLKSAITEQTRNLIIGKVSNSSVDGNGRIVTTTQPFDMWFAPIESGKTYTVTTSDASGLVYAYFSSIPEIGSVSSTGSRIITNNKTFTASTSGYIAFRSASGYTYAQIEERESATAYIRPITAIDAVLREAFDSFTSESFVKGKIAGITPDRMATVEYALYSDFNNFGLDGCPANTIVRYANFSASDIIEHAPVLGFNGYVASFANTDATSEVAQIAMNEQGLVATRYFRRGADLTYPWHYVSKPVYMATNATQLFNLLQTLTTGTIQLREMEYDLYTGLYENLILADETARHFIDGDIEIIGAGSTLKLHIPQSVAEAHLAAANATSIIDILGNAKISGVIFDCKNTRYCCHYEASTERPAFYANVTFEDCEFHYTRELSGLNADCVGIGGSLGQNFAFRNCKFYNDIKGGIYIHTRTWCIGSLNVENCIFDCGWYGINLSQYTGTTVPIPVYIVNSKTGLVLISTQSGGLTAAQWKINYINSRYRQSIADGTTLLYAPNVFDITTE